MTPLDQAFIRAYTQPGELKPAGVVHRIDQEPLAEPGGKADSQAVPRPHMAAGISTAAEGIDEPVDTLASADRAALVDADTPAERGFPVAEGFQPMLQVDQYTWPRVCRRLSGSARDELEQLTDTLVAATARGHRVLAIGGCQSGEGATTMVLCAGRRLARRGHKVIMVDANLADPQLAKRLGLAPQFGWEDVLAGRLPLGEAVIESTQDRLAVLPLREPFAGRDGVDEDETRPAENIETLAAYYDLVLVDLGPLEGPDAVGGPLARAVASRLDAILLVQDVRATSDRQLAEVRRYLAATDIAQPGIIQNFAPA